MLVRFQSLRKPTGWVHWDGSPLDKARGVAANNAHISQDFVESVLLGENVADVSMLAFRDPKSFMAGSLHSHVKSWENMCQSTPCDLAQTVLGWVKHRINVFDFLQPFKGQFKGETFDCNLPPSRVFQNNVSCKPFKKFISSTIVENLNSGSISFWGKVGEVDPPLLVMPLTVEPSKPRLCHDNRFLNLWTKDLPFKLDKLSFLRQYVTIDSYQTICDDKSGYHHIFVTEESRKFFGFQWEGHFYVSNVIPFGWKSSAYIYHSTGLMASHFFRSLGIPCLLYIDDRHTGEIVVGKDSPAYANLSKPLERGKARASSAAFVVCLTLTSLGYFIGLKKSTLLPSQRVVYLGLEVDSTAQAFKLPEDKRLKFVALTDTILSSKQVDIKTLQRFAGKCISFALAVPGARLFINEVHSAISKGARSCRPVRIEGRLRDEIAHWTFLRNWQGSMPWLQEKHVQFKLSTDASNFAWGGVLDTPGQPLVIRDYWPHEHLRMHINIKETLALVNVIDSFHDKIQGCWVDVYTDSQVLLSAWNRQGSKSPELSDALKRLFWTCVKWNTFVNLSYVPSERNVADQPSRTLALQDSMLAEDPWSEIEKRFGPHSADLMALPSNGRRDLKGNPLPFVSPYPTPGCSGVNIFAQSPQTRPDLFVKPYVFPPIALLAQVFKFLQRFGVAFTMCVPDVQPRRCWWPSIKGQASDSFVLARKGSCGIVLPPSPEGFSCDWPLPWDLWVFHFKN